MEFKEILQYITVHPETKYFMFMTEGNEDIYAKPGLYNVMFDKTLEHIIKEEGEPFKFTGVLVIQYNKDKQQIMESYLGTKLKKVWMDTFFFYEDDKYVGSARYEYTYEGKIHNIDITCSENAEDSKFQEMMKQINKKSMEEAG